METECYPAIPMHSASNQQNQQSIISVNNNNNNSTQLSLLKHKTGLLTGSQPPARRVNATSVSKIGLGGETITIKHEPVESEQVNVVDDDAEMTAAQSAVSSAESTAAAMAAFGESVRVKLSRKRNSLSQLLPATKTSSIGSIIGSSNSSVIATTVNGNAVFVTRPSLDQPSLQITRVRTKTNNISLFSTTLDL